MTPEQIDDVWAVLDREHLAAITRRGPTPVFASISGAHLYGFASPDSDVDLRGAFLWPAQAVLSLHPPAETITIEPEPGDGGLELDWVAHDLRKFARLLTNHNGYVLEQLFSPLVVVSTPAHEELMELGKGCVTRPTVRHYLGFARGRRKRLAEPEPTVKHLLYAYRVLLTGIHMMQTGEVISNLSVLNQRFGLTGIDELVDRKRTGAEKMRLDERELAAQEAQLGELETKLRQAHEHSQLPEEPTTADALDAFVVRLRLDQALADRAAADTDRRA
ncbi:nucleotidyltransferase domain-containing protein [Haliangium sp.]|uniref:nucleotidyltransferase domain-containing protein n=1 Tax=Haliangium sp. TaxID=2663208 RepID=UPI003D11046A